MRGGREDYVRPPLVPRETGSLSRTVWRFRLGALVALVIVVLVLVKLFLQFSGIGTEDPGLNGGLSSPRSSVLLAAP